MMTSDALSPWPILTATGALTAFHIGLYTLVGRERKSPYLINSIFPIFLFTLVVATIVVISTLVAPEYQSVLIFSSKFILALALIYSFVVVFRVTIRFTYFVDSISLKHLPVIRFLRRLPQRFGTRPTYAHDPIPIPNDLEREIIEILKPSGESNNFSLEEVNLKSLAVKTSHQNQCNELLVKLALLFLNHDFTIQYLTASRHPIEFIEILKDTIDKSKIAWAQHAKKIVVIDAYSPHFGFIDSIYEKKTRSLEGLNVNCETSKMTYAGMHSASSRAFNTIQEKAGKGAVRKPTLVIYEGAYALTDLESPEQYRIFVRHVLPSERMWDGMFTVFVESSQPEIDWNLLKSYTSMMLDLREVQSTLQN
jgi:hypothetical protein